MLFGFYDCQLSKEEINRKIITQLPSLYLELFFYAPKTTYLSKLDASYIVIFLFFLSLVIEFARFKFAGFGQIFTRSFGLMLREEKTDNSREQLIFWLGPEFVAFCL